MDNHSLLRFRLLSTYAKIILIKFSLILNSMGNLFLRTTWTLPSWIYLPILITCGLVKNSLLDHIIYRIVYNWNIVNNNWYELSMLSLKANLGKHTLRFLLRSGFIAVDSKKIFQVKGDIESLFVTITLTM